MGMREQVDAAAARAEQPSDYSERRLAEIAATLSSIRMWVQVMGWTLLIGLLVLLVAVAASR